MMQMMLIFMSSFLVIAVFVVVVAMIIIRLLFSRLKNYHNNSDDSLNDIRSFICIYFQMCMWSNFKRNPKRSDSFDKTKRKPTCKKRKRHSVICWFWSFVLLSDRIVSRFSLLFLIYFFNKNNEYMMY